MLGALAFVGLAEARMRLRQPNEDRNAIIERMIDAACDYLERKIGRPIKARDVVNGLHNGDGSCELVTNLSPVISVDAIRVLNSVMPEVWLPVDLSTYPVVVVEPGLARIHLRGSYFPCGRQNVALDYRAGFEAVPDGLREAALEAVKCLYRQFEKNPDDAAAITFAGNSVNVELDRALPKLTLDLLAGYRRRTA